MIISDGSKSIRDEWLEACAELGARVVDDAFFEEGAVFKSESLASAAIPALTAHGFRCRQDGVKIYGTSMELEKPLFRRRLDVA